jgi:hypothetical protein
MTVSLVHMYTPKCSIKIYRPYAKGFDCVVLSVVGVLQLSLLPLALSKSLS